MFTDLILGTAGHIDHGKTSLIKALTGTNTDRLPEEKKRGITIELGYAHLALPPFRIGVVDVPGHEKFIRQMLAGATGMDLVLLVVAADDSVKQQTREHLEILRLLDLPAGVIALTKCDLVEPEWVDLVEAEIRDLVRDSFLADAPIIRTSTKTGKGIEDLKSAIEQACRQVEESNSNSRLEDSFRMAIDRAFTIDGHGTIVTGSVSSGTVNVADQLEIQPGRIQARVRSLQNHDSNADSVRRGQRAAINLAGVSLTDISRGHELSSIGHLQPSELMTLRIKLLDSAGKPLKDRSRINFHIGTAELTGKLRFLDINELQPGASALVQIFLHEPAVAVWNQPFVIRRQSPAETIGGGRVIQPNARPLRKATKTEMDQLQALSSEDPVTRASAAIYFADLKTWTPSELARTAGTVEIKETLAMLMESRELIEMPLTSSRSAIVHRLRIEELGERILKVLARLHREHPLRFSHPRTALIAEFDYLDYPELLNLAVELVKQRKLVVTNVNSIGLSGYGPKLSKGQKQLLEQLVQEFKNSGLQAPSISEVKSGAKKNKSSVLELLDLASENGELVKIAGDLFLHVETMQATQTQLANALQSSGGLTMSEIRKILDTSRKYAVPLCEYLDRIGFTQRIGDKRILNADLTPSI